MNPAINNAPRILLIGTADTKGPELLYLRERIAALGGTSLVMDVGVLESASFTPEISNQRVAGAAGMTIAQVMASGDENTAMTAMARGASLLAKQLHDDKAFDGMLALGGTMGTDLSLDVAAALPLGIPKVLLSTIAHSPLLPTHRIAPDLITILWAGGLYGLNAICKSSLSQAAGTVVGASRAAVAPTSKQPLIGMTSLGSSGLKYMVHLKPELERRGYDLAVFHTTGMGGHAFETLAEQGRFAAVFDFSLQELANHVCGSCVSSGPNRLLSAGLNGVPQLVATGAIDMVDFQAWEPVPHEYQALPFHAHNRLIASASTPATTRRRVAKAIKSCLAQAKGPTALLLPLKGVNEWDRPGQPLHDPVNLKAFMDETQDGLDPRVELHALDLHINDKAFAQAALAIFDRWVAAGSIAPGVH